MDNKTGSNNIISFKGENTQMGQKAKKETD
jgi:hypothetical protein